MREEEMEKVKEKLKNEEGSGTMHVHEVLRRDRENYAKEYAKEVVRKTKLEQAIMLAKKMLEEKVDINIITKITGLKKEQFMKQQMQELLKNPIQKELDFFNDQITMCKQIQNQKKKV